MPELTTTRRWTLPALIAFYEAHGRMPFPLQGGDKTDGDGGAGGDDGDDGAGGDGGKGDADDRAELKDALRKEREARKTADRELKKLQGRIDELDGRDKSDVERLTKERDQLKTDLADRETKVRERVGRVAAIEAAGKANAVSTKAVYALIRDDIDFDDDGEPTNVERLIAQAKKDEPQLFRAAVGSGDGGKGGDTPQDENERMNQLIRQAAGR